MLIELDDYELRMLMHAMKSYRRDLEKKARRNVASGWKPQPGSGDIVEAQQRRWESLNERLRSIKDMTP